MKKFLVVVLLLSTQAFSAEFTSLMTNPKVLELKKYRNINDTLELKYIHESPRVVVKIGSGSKEIYDFLGKVKKSDLLKLNCDGDFTLIFDRFGNQVIQVNSINACVDENGKVVAHSIGINALSSAQVAASAKFIEDNMKVQTAVAAPQVKDDTKPKQVVNPKAGVFSLDLEEKAVAK
jgi:hypothetical protein